MYKIVKQVTSNGRKYAQESNDRLFKDFNEAYEVSKEYGIIGGKEVDYPIYGRRKFVSEGLEVETHVATVGKDEEEEINVKNYLKTAFEKDFKEWDRFYVGKGEMTLSIELMAKAINSEKLELIDWVVDTWNDVKESIFVFQLNGGRYIAKTSKEGFIHGRIGRTNRLTWAKIPSAINI